MSTEAKIIAEIETLRLNELETQDLYREVCTILFFRYGITPTANKLYQYVRKGSMSAPAEALARFWSDLREKSRVRIEHPDLPDGLRTAAGELVASLWSQAQASAQEGLVVFRQEAQAQINNYQQACEVANHACSTAQSESSQIQKNLSVANERILQLERNLSAESAKRHSLEKQLETASRQQTILEASLAEARKDYSAELEKSRLELRRAEARLADNENRALLEIDHERQTTVKTQRELSQLRERGIENEERQRIELATSKNELSETKQQLGIAEGKLAELRVVNIQQFEELSLLRQIQAKQETQLALLQQETEFSQVVVRKLHESIAAKPVSSKVLRRNRKATP